MDHWLGFALALASTTAIELGYLAMQRGAHAMPPMSLRRPIMLVWEFIRSRVWVAGFCIGALGWACYIAALQLATLSTVQAVAAAGLGLLVLLVAIVDRAMPTRGVAIATLVALAGLVVLAYSTGETGALDNQAIARMPGSWELALVLLAGAVAAAVSVAASLRGGIAALSGVAAGLCYGLADVGTKALLGRLPDHFQIVHLIGAPLLYGILTFHLASFIVLQLAFQRGGAIATIGPMTVSMNVVPIIAGLTLFGDPLPGSDAGKAVYFAALVLVIGAAFVLSRAYERTVEESAGLVLPSAVDAPPPRQFR